MPDHVWIIEDSVADVQLLKLAFRDAGLDVWFEVLESGLEAVNRVMDVAAGILHAPDLIVLDLDLPGRSGREVLELIRSHSRLDPVPVVVLTGSVTAQQELERLGADGYVVKPTRYADLLDVVKELRSYLPSTAG